MNKADRIMALLKDGVKISCALREVCGRQKISIPFTYEVFDVSLEELELSTRSYNALKRSKLNTLADVVRYFDESGWNSIKNLGQISAMEIFGKIIDVAWDGMSAAQRTDFLNSI
jgi:DNA-directed RNA polymerase alpha subunit